MNDEHGMGRRGRRRSRVGLVCGLVILLAGLGLAGGLAVAPVPVHAATVSVATCDESGLTTAISNAGNGGIVQFTADCTITLASTITLGQSVTLDSNGHAVTIGGGGSVEVFSVSSGATVTLGGLTISYGKSVAGLYGNGGGIDNAGTLTLNNSTVSDNDAGVDQGNGGGIYNDGGTLTLNNSTVADNTTGTTDFGGHGGGIDNEGGGTVLLINSTVSGNSTSYGQGCAIYNDGSTLTLTSSTISGNGGNGVGCETGGGIYNVNDYDSNGNVLATGAVTLINSTVSGNHSGSFGGGGLANGGTMSLINSTVSDNYSAVAAGLAGGATMTNSILAGNYATSPGEGQYSDCNGTITDGGNNLVGIGNQCSGLTNGANGDLVGTYANPINPKLGPLQNNGGPNDTQALLSGSPAIGAGSTSVCTAAPISGVDQRGDPRNPYSCDIGAYDTDDPITPAAVTLSSLSQTYDGSPESAGALVNPPSCGPVTLSYNQNGTPVSAPTNAGSYSVQASLSNPNCTISSGGTGTLTIGQAPLTITASSAAVTYGAAAPAISPSYSGFIGTDSASTSLSTQTTCSTTYTQGSGVSGSPYPTSCSGAVSTNYSPSYVNGSVTVHQAPQTITFAALPNRLLGIAPFPVNATGGASGNPVTFTAGPGTVCTASGTNGAAIALVGVGTCTVTANQAGNANYLAAASVAQGFSVAYPPLYLVLSLTSSPAGPVTTGSTVTAMFTLGNHTTATQTVTLKVTLSYTGSKGSLSLTVPLTFKLSAGQTVSQTRSFTIARLFPRGSYMLSATASDKSGDSASSSATLTVS